MILVATGRYFDDMQAAIAVRLDAIARQATAVRFSSFILNDGAQRLAGLDAAPDALAVISPLPPEKTGLANFTLRTFCEAGCPVDIFSRFSDAASYLALSCDKSLAAAGITFLPIDLLPAARARRHYLAQIYEIGNSDHNLPVWESVAAQASFPTEVLTFLHIHDPCLLNLLRASVAARGRDLIEVVSRYYGAEVASRDESFLFSHGVLGPRALFPGVAGVHLLTNSRAASELLEQDWPELRERTHTLFHPAFPVPATLSVPATRAGTIRIGTFGIPSTAKCSETIVAAFRLLAREIDSLELVIGGYDASQFARQFRLQDTPAIKVFDSPSDADLWDLMQSCNLAVQLRLENRGESSGVVPQLISLGVPVIVSQIGAFAEYGEAAAYVPPRCSARILAEAICTELSQAGRHSAAERSYAAAHTPAAFCKELRSLAIELAPQRCVTEAT